MSRISLICSLAEILDQKEGKGWRVAIDTTRGKFSVLIGGDGWAIELDKHEWEVLVPLITEIIDQYERQSQNLMDEETISLEMERLPWWACLEGQRDSWDFRLILYGDNEINRGAEISWPNSSAQAVTSAMRSMWESS